MLLALTLFDPSALAGLLSPIFFLLAVALGAWAYARVHIAKAQDQAITTWRQNSEAQEERAEIYEKRFEEMRRELAAERELKHTVLADLAAEKLKTDQTVVLAEIVRFHEEFANREVLFHRIFDELTTQRHDVALQMKAMEERLVAALAKQTVALDLIATKINGGPHA